MDDDFLVPDVVGEIIGWRAWYVVKFGRRYRLASLMTMGRRGSTIPSTWKPGQWYQGRCFRHRSHDAFVPVANCSCGVYAARSLRHLMYLGYNGYHDDRPKVIGQIALVGRVVVAEQGWRASSARPVKLYVPHQYWRIAEELQETYSVPVVLDNLFDPKAATKEVETDGDRKRA